MCHAPRQYPRCPSVETMQLTPSVADPDPGMTFEPLVLASVHARTMNHEHEARTTCKFLVEFIISLTESFSPPEILI